MIKDLEVFDARSCPLLGLLLVSNFSILFITIDVAEVSIVIRKMCVEVIGILLEKRVLWAAIIGCRG